MMTVLALSATPVAAATPPVQITATSEDILDSMVAASGEGGSDAASGQFLGTPYGANTLIGSAEAPEQLVVDLERVDCFTYADYVEALKRAGDRTQFIDSLVNIRYKDGVVGFLHRKHFFTDWAATAPPVATDVTASLSDNTIQTNKHLNEKDGGGLYLPGLPVVDRAVSYLPSELVDSDVVSRLRTGDYLGAYAEDGGLDVTHVGIFIDTPEGPVFRNASSLQVNNKVVDTALFDYLQTVPGVVVLRPLV
jgi:hypothetical protein